MARTSSKDDNDNKTNKRGFAAMDSKKQRDIASMGGHAQGKENNPGNFARDHDKARRAGHEGGSK